MSVKLGKPKLGVNNARFLTRRETEITGGTRITRIRNTKKGVIFENVSQVAAKRLSKNKTSLKKAISTLEDFWASN